MGKLVSLIIDPATWEAAKVIAKRERRSLSAQISVWIETQLAQAQAPVLMPPHQPAKEEAQP